MTNRRIEYVPLDEVEPATRNPRRHGIDGIRASIGRFGFATPALRDERTGRLVAGHGRTLALAAMKADGEDPPAGIRLDGDRWLVPVICGWESRSDAEADAYLVADNRHTELAGWDDAGLHELLSSIGEVDPELVAIAGYDDEDLAALLGEGGKTELPPALNDPDAIPSLPAEPATTVGDIWIMGPHRVLCGDSTNPDNWDALLVGERPALVFTDPPYGIKYKLHLDSGRAKRNDFIKNDSSPDEALQVTRDALALLYDAEAHFVCCDWRSLATIIEAMLGAAIEPKACIVWDKKSRVQNLDRYAKQHEFMVYAGPYGGQSTVCTDVWEHPRDLDPDHPTPKPVGLIAQALETASSRGALVADAFGGSGSTLIAAHTTGRVARVIELDPRYVDVIARRWQEHTGEKPVLASTGKPHDFTTAD